MPVVPRALKLGLAGLAVLVFLVISAGLARILSANNAERDAIRALMASQASGDAAGVVRQLSGCAPSSSCRARQRANVARLRHPGAVKLASVEPSSRFVLGSMDGTTRVAWTVVGTGRTTVQCVGVRRTGNVVTGMGVKLTALSAPIDPQSDCPARR
jgi:hypothetical protein